MARGAGPEKTRAQRPGEGRPAPGTEGLQIVHTGVSSVPVLTIPLQVGLSPPRAQLGGWLPASPRVAQHPLHALPRGWFWLPPGLWVTSQFYLL